MIDNPESIDYCQSCKAAMDVSDFAPFSNVICPHCGQNTHVKVNFGSLTLTRRHAVGGMSMVFAAQDSTLNREVIVKILSEEYSNDEVRIAAFEQEARLTASFSHPNVVRVLRTGRAFGRFYIAMEFVSGGHFEYHIRQRGRIPEVELLPLAIEVAQGLKAAQAAGLIHRDVKPGNILLDSDGRAKLVDFGLALVTHGGKAKATELWATPFYVPPETVEEKEEDFRSDIYALGSTLYHALAGVPPCNEDSMATEILLKAKQEIVPLSSIVNDVSAETCEIVTKMMAYHPEGRFSSYDELLRQLKASLNHLQSGRPLAPSRREARNPKILIGKLVPPIAIAALLLGGLLIWNSHRSKTGNITQTGNPNPPDPNNPNNPNPDDSRNIADDYNRARAAMKSHNYSDAADIFQKLLNNGSVQEPTRSWAGIEAIICQYLNGNTRNAEAQAKDTLAHIKTLPDDIQKIGTEFPRILSQINELPPITLKKSTDPETSQLIAAILAGLKNWEQGMLNQAALCFRSAQDTTLKPEDQWAEVYKRIAADYLTDYEILRGPLFHHEPRTSAECDSTINELNPILDKLKTRGRARFNVKSWQLDLAKKSKILKDKSTASRDKSPEQ